MGLIIASCDRPDRSTKIICTPSRWSRPRINSEYRLLQNDAGGRATFHMPWNWTFSSTWNPHLTLNVGLIVFKTSFRGVIHNLEKAQKRILTERGQPEPYIAWCVCIAWITRKSLMTWTTTLPSEEVEYVVVGPLLSFWELEEHTWITCIYSMNGKSDYLYTRPETISCHVIHDFSLACQSNWWEHWQLWCNAQQIPTNETDMSTHS